jgi:hypothetical protein
MGIFDALLSPDFRHNPSRRRTCRATSPIRKPRTNTSFEDLVTAASQSQQVGGSVTTSSQATNSVQGAIQNTSVSTDMAINGNGYFVVAQPQSIVGSTGIPWQPLQQEVGFQLTRGRCLLRGRPVSPYCVLHDRGDPFRERPIAWRLSWPCTFRRLKYGY